jgi:hypothetical protein
MTLNQVFFLNTSGLLTLSRSRSWPITSIVSIATGNLAAIKN